MLCSSCLHHRLISAPSWSFLWVNSHFSCLASSHLWWLSCRLPALPQPESAPLSCHPHSSADPRLGVQQSQLGAELGTSDIWDWMALCYEANLCHGEGLAASLGHESLDASSAPANLSTAAPNISWWCCQMHGGQGRLLLKTVSFEATVEESDCRRKENKGKLIP